MYSYTVLSPLNDEIFGSIIAHERSDHTPLHARWAATLVNLRDGQTKNAEEIFYGRFPEVSAGVIAAWPSSEFLFQCRDWLTISPRSLTLSHLHSPPQTYLRPLHGRYLFLFIVQEPPEQTYR